MKMSDKLFAALKADCIAVCKALDVNPDGVDTGAAAWNAFHIVARNRSYDGEHPGFASGHWARLLPCDCEPGTNYYDRFYRDEDLTDAHIKTALAKISPNAVFKDKYRH